MENIVLIGTLVGSLTVTSYRPIPSQTDSTPLYTSTNEHIFKGGAAISRDLLCGACRKLHNRCKHPEYPKRIHYGDLLYVKDVGIMKVNDSMGSTKLDKRSGKRITIKNSIDILVLSYSEEKAIGVKTKAVYKLREYAL